VNEPSQREGEQAKLLKGLSRAAPQKQNQNRKKNENCLMQMAQKPKDLPGVNN